MAGHSKWANIKHRKGRQDARRSKIWSRCSRAIIVAAKAGGGDPDMNLTLRYAIIDAKAENMPKDTITNAIKKGTGEIEGVNYEQISYEGYGPNGVAVLLDILTDNRNRTAPEVKKIFERCGGNMGTTGCVSYIFSAKGHISINTANVDEETIMDLALEAGAEDIQQEEDTWLITTEFANLYAVKDALEAKNLKIESAKQTMVPDNTVECEGRNAEKIFKMLEAFDDHEDVQKVHANYEISDDEMERVANL